MSTVVLQITNTSDPALLGLAQQLDCYLDGLYPAASNYAMSLEELQRANAVFVIALVDDQVAGCGGFIKEDDQRAELKRMIVLPAFRGRAIGSRILGELASLVRAAGLLVARLETGVSQPDAIRLFEKAGYHRRGPFGNYPDDPLSVFMAKSL